MLEVREGSRGPLVLWNQKQLNSAYNAQKEAESWVRDRPKNPGTLVLVSGDVLGLAGQCWQSYGCRAVALVPGAETLDWIPEGIRVWYPTLGRLDVFLRGLWEEWGLEAVQWEVWPAWERNAPEVAADWNHQFRDAYRAAQGSWLTQQYFGRRFWRNSLRNLLDWQTPGRLRTGNRPILVAASGPSLDRGWTYLESYREAFELWALPSSFAALSQRGIRADLAIATDGGFWARDHLQRLAGTKTPVVAGLSSAPDPELSHRPCLFFDQGMFHEGPLLETFLDNTGLKIPSQGTVAITAIRLALASTTGPVAVAGLDLCFEDLRGHATPHSVERRIEDSTNRLAPSESAWAQRTWSQAPLTWEGARTSSAMVTYALWLRSQLRLPRTPIRLEPSAIRWSTMEESTWEPTMQAWTRRNENSPATFVPDQEIPKQLRRQRLAEGLQRLRQSIERMAPNSPEILEAAKTAIPEAWKTVAQARRRGIPFEDLRIDLKRWVDELEQEFLE